MGNEYDQGVSTEKESINGQQTSEDTPPLVFSEMQSKTISYLSDWYNFLKPDGRLLKKQEFPNTIDRSINWYNHVGEQVGNIW